MMNAKDLWLNYHRMCDNYTNCRDCPACLDYENYIILCDDMKNIDKFIEVVEKWAKDNPIISNKQKFKEVFGCDLSSINIKTKPCGFYKEKDCMNFKENSRPCSDCPWWDEKYTEVKK